MKKKKIKTITGSKKRLINLLIKGVTFLYFLKDFLLGRIKPVYFLRFLRRLLFFLSQMGHNKYVKIGSQIKINLYVPAFPSKAFFTACKKVQEFRYKMPCITVLLSITSACRFRCQHCYQRFDKGKDIDIDTMIKVAKNLQNRGVAFFNIEGGEPFIVYDRLKKLCESIDDRSEILINSTGDGMTRQRLIELRKHNNIIGIMFSLHTYKAEILNGFMGRDNAWETLIKGINLCHETGIPVTFNSCLAREAFYDGTFEKVMELARDLNGAIVQLIKPKSAGGWLESGADFFSDEDVEFIKNRVHEYNLKKRYRQYPYIAAMVIEEDKALFGCTSGGTDRFYINAKGDVQPCEFLNISFGNISKDNFNSLYEKMRQEFQVPGECWLCEKYSKDIFKYYENNHLNTLPLPPELSQKIYTNWDRGKPTGFYKKIREL
jgi:MoaA/NifB/PqqE/SkfB family radical SAM enzyme